jgi:hypothetical protein
MICKSAVCGVCKPSITARRSMIFVTKTLALHVSFQNGFLVEHLLQLVRAGNLKSEGVLAKPVVDSAISPSGRSPG